MVRQYNTNSKQSQKQTLFSTLLNYKYKNAAANWIEKDIFITDLLDYLNSIFEAETTRYSDHICSL